MSASTVVEMVVLRDGEFRAVLVSATCSRHGYDDKPIVRVGPVAAALRDHEDAPLVELTERELRIARMLLTETFLRESTGAPECFDPRPGARR